MRKIDMPLHTPLLLYKIGIQGVHITRKCFPDESYRVAIPYINIRKQNSKRLLFSTAKMILKPNQNLYVSVKINSV